MAHLEKKSMLTLHSCQHGMKQIGEVLFFAGFSLTLILPYQLVNFHKEPERGGCQLRRKYKAERDVFCAKWHYGQACVNYLVAR